MFGILLGLELPRPASLVIAFLVVAALIGVTAWLVRRFGANRRGGSARRRLAVIDAARVDKSRSVVLIRRDNIEHLLMIGGPTDMVIEPNIVRVIGERARPVTPAPAPPTAELSTRPPAAPSWLLDKSEVPRPAERPHVSSLTQRRLAELADRLNHRSSASVQQRPELTKGEPAEAAGKKLYGNLEDDLATLLGRAAGSRGGV
jgi:flagellar protein FliO/FliZ